MEIARTNGISRAGDSESRTPGLTVESIAGEVVDINESTGTLAIPKGTAEFVERFLFEADIAASTKESYRKALKQFFVWYEEQGLQGIARTDILAYKQALLQRVQASTAGAYLSALKSFFKWMEAEKLHPNIAAAVKGTKVSRTHRKDALTASQVGYILDTMKGETEQELRDYAIFNLLVRTGLRTVEAHRADIGDIRTRGGRQVLYVQGKGRSQKDEFVVLTDAAVRPIYAYLAARTRREADQPLFASISNKNKDGRLSIRAIRAVVKGALRKAGLDEERLTSHSLRHTAVTLSLLGGASIQQAQALARHSNIATTLIYAHNIDRIGNAPELMIDKMLE